MKTTLRLTIAAFGLAVFNLTAATLYVSLESRNPIPPYATWDTAANVIQDAVDAAKDGDTVLVTNGVYAVGGKTTSDWYGFSGDRVSVTNAVRLESVNGPLLTTIEGTYSVLRNDAGEWLGRVSMRCVHLGSNAVLSGFTLTNGCENGREGGWCAYGGTLYNCLLTGNRFVEEGAQASPPVGGAAQGSRLYNCTLTNNVGGNGAAFDCRLYYCTVLGNGSGGVLGCELHNCTVTGNTGGGDQRGNDRAASESTLYNCTVTGNSGIGAANSTLYNCTVTGNSDGGAAGSSLYNCTVVGNVRGGLVNPRWGWGNNTLYNSIVYYNSGTNYAEGTTLNYCCTTPLPTNGIGNITGPPLFVDLAGGDFRLWEDSPCIDAGTNLVGFSATVTDSWGGVSVISYAHDPTDILGNTRFIDGNGDGRVAWDIGAYEFNSFRPPRFSIAPQRTSDGWTLNITGAPNKWVHLQRSGNLKDWEEIWSGFMWEANQQVNDADTGPGAMFYRVVVP